MLPGSSDEAGEVAGGLPAPAASDKVSGASSTFAFALVCRSRLAAHTYALTLCWPVSILPP